MAADNVRSLTDRVVLTKDREKVGAHLNGRNRPGREESKDEGTDEDGVTMTDFPLDQSAQRGAQPRREVFALPGRYREQRQQRRHQGQREYGGKDDTHRGINAHFPDADNLRDDL